MIESDRILLAELVALKAKGSVLSSQQLSEWNRLLKKYPETNDLVSTLFDKAEINTVFDIRNIDPDLELEIFHHNRAQNQTKVRNLITWRSIAAMVAIVICIGTIWTKYFKNNKQSYIIADNVYGQKNDILPGESYAELILEDQNTITLKGSTSYNDIVSSAKESASHTLSVPIRSTYNIILSDGTKVWVNPDSKLFYQAHFSRSERRVRLEGEAYFEVAKDHARPFIVETDGMDIQAVGTAFNVKSYNKMSSVQLTEGKIKVKKDGQELEIDAGNQVLSKQGQLTSAILEHPEAATSWKEGFFSFDDKEITEIMDELSRWYGIKISYNCTLDTKRYVGGINKNSTLAQVCGALAALTNYKFQINDNNLLISNKNK